MNRAGSVIEAIPGEIRFRSASQLSPIVAKQDNGEREEKIWGRFLQPGFMGNLAAIDWHSAAIWFISLASIALVLARPKGLPEAIWAAAGAIVLVLCRLISPRAAAGAVGKGIDVYLFLAGMMVISELASREGVFDWVAGYAVRGSRGSVLVYWRLF